MAAKSISPRWRGAPRRVPAASLCRRCIALLLSLPALATPAPADIGAAPALALDGELQAVPRSSPAALFPSGSAAPGSAEAPPDGESLTLAIDYGLRSAVPATADSPVAASPALDLEGSAGALQTVELAAIHGSPLVAGRIAGKADSAPPAAEPPGLPANSPRRPAVAGVQASIDCQ